MLVVMRPFNPPLPFGIQLKSLAAIVIASGLAIAPCHAESSLGSSKRQKPIADMDFELVGGRIYVPCTINGHVGTAVLDTGAGANVLNLNLVERWKLKSSGALNVQGAGEKTITGKMLSDTSLKIGPINVSMMFAIPIPELSAMEGRPMQAIVGYGFFSKYIVEIDYAKKHLRVFNPEDAVKAKGMEVPIHFVSALPHISSAMTIGDQTYKMETMVDTGASAASLTTHFLQDHPLKVESTPETIIGAGVGGSTLGRLFRPTSVEIAGSSFAKPVIAMTTSKGGVIGGQANFDFLMGADFLKRFVVTVDYPHKKFIFDPNETVNTPFEADKVGLRIYSEGADYHTFRVVGVLDGASGSKAGIKPDDLIASIDGKPASEYSLTDLRELFKSPAATEWKVGLIRKGQPIQVVIAAKSII